MKPALQMLMPALALVLSAPLYARAQSAPASTGTSSTPNEPDLEAGKRLEEAPDPTRLDVSRLPAEALEVTRDLYAHGFFLEAQLGAMGFVGDASKVSQPGPRLAITPGYEFTDWLSVIAVLEGSLHQTKNRPPPGHTSYELAGAALGLRLTLPFNARYALWASGQAGIVWTGGDVLRGLGFKKAAKLGVDYGGELGFDWHVRAVHHSFGLLGGARVYPSLAKTDTTVGLYGSVYLRYVF
jgi:hypothetical protein